MRLLGPTEATADGQRLTVPGAKTRALLVRLALSPGVVVSADRLVDDLWGELAPRNALNALQVKVSALRRALAGHAEVIGRKPGYLLDVAWDQVDALRAERMVADGHRLVVADPVAASALLARALALWSGPSFSGLRAAPFAVSAAAHWDDLRLGAQEQWFALEIAAGRSALAGADLEVLTAEHPLREPLHELLVGALVAQGRQADALAVLRRIRARLVEDLGIDPGPGLQRLEQRVLSQDPSLIPNGPPSAIRVTEVPVSNPSAPADARPVAGSLPRPLTSFLHREPDIAAVQALLRRHRLVTVTGPGGVGKTRLAIEVGHLVLDAPDGVWFVALDGVDSSGQAADAIATVVGAAGQDSLAALRIRLRAAELLLILDNCEHLGAGLAEAVVSLLGVCPQLKVLATSQRPLNVMGEALWPLEPLDRPAAVDLFVARAREVQPRIVLDAATLGAAETLCERLDDLPLAVELAAARCRTLPVAELVSRLADRFELLVDPRTGRSARHQTLSTTIGWSYDILFPDAQTTLQALAFFSGGAPLPGVESVLSHVGVPASDASDLIAQLVDRSLVIADQHPTGLRYRTLESIRAFAREQADLDGRASRLEAAQAQWARQLAVAAADGMLSARQGDWVRLVRVERANLDTALGWLLPNEPVEGFALAAGLYWAWLVAGDGAAGANRLHAAVEAAGARVAEVDRGLALARAGSLLARTGSPERGLESVRRALPLVDPRHRRAAAEVGSTLGLMYVHLGRISEGSALIARSLGIFRMVGDRWGEAMCLLRLGFAAQRSGDAAGGLEVAEQARELTSALADRWSMHAALRLIGVFQTMRGDLTGAAQTLQSALLVARETGFAADEAQTLGRIGDIQQLRGDLPAATQALAAALELTGRLGDAASAAQLRSRLIAVLRCTGDLEAARALLAERTGWVSGLPSSPAPLAVRVQAAALTAMEGVPGAVELLEGSLRVAEIAGDIEQQVLALDALGAAHRRSGDASGARAAAELADQLAAQLSGGAATPGWPLIRSDLNP